MSTRVRGFREEGTSRPTPLPTRSVSPADGVGVQARSNRFAIITLSRATTQSWTSLAGRSGYQLPVFSMLDHGSAGAFDSPFCSSSIEIPSGERTKAMWPSRGGRLIVTPPSCSFSQVA